MTGELKMNGQPISGLNEPTEGTQAAPKSYVDKRVPLDGSVPMGGNLAMGGNRITGLAGPEDGGDAATKGYTDDAIEKLLKKSGGIMTGEINMNGQPISGLNAPTEGTQAANKAYVDDSIGLKMDLLWTNASPTSQFTEQDISFINNNYKLIGMYYNRANASWVSTRDTYDFVILGIGKNHTLQHFAGLNGSLAYHAYRDINIGTNSINFSNGYFRATYSGDKQIDNQAIIPIEIYGIK